MKRFIFILSLFIYVAQSCTQLEQVDYERGYLGRIKVETITYKHIIDTYVIQDMYNYYIIAQTYETDFNSSYEPIPNSRIFFCLGTSQHEAIKTLKRIKHFILLHRVGKGIEVLDCNSTIFHIHKTQRDEVFISSKHYTNNRISLTINDIRTAIYLIRK